MDRQKKKFSTSVTRLGDFRKFLVTNYPTKVAQMYGDFWAILENITSKQKLLWAISWNVSGSFYFNIWSHCLLGWFVWRGKKQKKSSSIKRGAALLPTDSCLHSLTKASLRRTFWSNICLIVCKNQSGYPRKLF